MAEATGPVSGPMTVRELVVELAMGPVEDFDRPAIEVLSRPDLQGALNGSTTTLMDSVLGTRHPRNDQCASAGCKPATEDGS